MLSKKNPADHLVSWWSRRGVSVWRSTFFQARRRYEAWSWYECISPDDYCGWSTPLAVNGGKRRLNTITNSVSFVYKTSQQNITLYLCIHFSQPPPNANIFFPSAVSLINEAPDPPLTVTPKYFLTSWANSTFCSSSLSSVCLALLSSNSSLLSLSAFFFSASAWTSSFCSISVRRFCCGGKSKRWKETGLRRGRVKEEDEHSCSAKAANVLYKYCM